MTSAHVLYIPIIFLLGFLSGSLVRKASNSSDNASNRLGITSRTLLGSFLIVMIVFVATHFFQIPRSSKAVTKALNGLEIFDKKPSFNSDEVYARIEMFPENGRELYKQFTYTIDVLFPMTLFAFIFLLAHFSLSRNIVPKTLRIIIIAVPITWLSMDFMENAIIYNLLDNFPLRNHTLASSLGYITMTKFSLLLLSILAPTAVITIDKTRRRVSTNA